MKRFTSLFCLLFVGYGSFSQTHQLSAVRYFNDATRVFKVEGQVAYTDAAVYVDETLLGGGTSPPSMGGCAVDCSGNDGVFSIAPDNSGQIYTVGEWDSVLVSSPIEQVAIVNQSSIFLQTIDGEMFVGSGNGTNFNYMGMGPLTGSGYPLFGIQFFGGQGIGIHNGPYAVHYSYSSGNLTATLLQTSLWHHNVYAFDKALDGSSASDFIGACTPLGGNLQDRLVRIDTFGNEFVWATMVNMGICKMANYDPDWTIIAYGGDVHLIPESGTARDGQQQNAGPVARYNLRTGELRDIISAPLRFLHLDVEYVDVDDASNILVAVTPSIFQPGEVWIGSDSFAITKPAVICFSPSTATAVGEEVGIKTIDVSSSPGPAPQALVHSIEEGNVSVTDLSGRVSHNIHLYENSETNISLDGFPSGTYFLRLTTENAIITEKLVVQR